MKAPNVRVVLDDDAPIALAAAFVEHRHSRAGAGELVRHLGKLWTFDKSRGHHVEIDDDELVGQVRAFLDRVAFRRKEEEAERIVPLKVRASHVREVMAALNDERRPSVPAMAALPFALPGYAGPDPRAIVVVRNGLLHLSSGDLHRAEGLFAAAGSAAAYDAAAECPTWDSFLAAIFRDANERIDHESIRLLQQWFGLLLTPDASLQKILLIMGPPRSGKSTIGRLLRELLGRGNVASPSMSSLQSQFGLAPLIGKSVALVGDGRAGRDSEAVAERLLTISGEDAVTVDRKFMPAVQTRLSVRIVIISNELPRLLDMSGALSSRFSIVETRRSFLGQEDPDLERRLISELPGILNWGIRGLRDLREQRRLVVPDRARETMLELEALGSPFKAFVAECCEVRAGLRIEMRALYNEWTRWCERSGRRNPGSIQAFGRMVRAAIPGLEVDRLRADGDRPRAYLGIALRGAR